MTQAQRSVRAFVLMAVGIAVGALVLAVGFDGSSESGFGTVTLPQPTATPEPTVEPAEGGDGIGTEDGGADDGSPTEETATPTPTPDPDLHPVSETRVIVANSTDVAGVAASVSDSLIANAGYNSTAANATGERNVLLTTVYFVEDYEADARRIAALAGLAPTAEFAAMPADPPVADISGVHVLVILGIEPTPVE